MYSLEQRLYAVDVLMKFNGNTRATIRELGYPNSRQTLSKWYKEFTENGELHKSFIKPRKYTDEDIDYAVNYYLKNGKNITKTVKDIGYLQSAHSNRRFCGAKRTRCGVSGLTSIIEIC